MFTANSIALSLFTLYCYSVFFLYSPINSMLDIIAFGNGHHSLN